MPRFLMMLVLLGLIHPLAALAGESQALPKADLKYLEGVYRDTFAGLDHFTEKGSGMPYDVSNGKSETSISNIGLYMAAVAVAGKTGVIPEAQAEEKLDLTFTSLEKIQKWHGFPVTWVNVQNGGPAFGPKFSYADHNGNLISGLLVVAGLYPEAFAKRVEAYLAPMDFKACYDSAAGKVKGGYDLAKNDFDVQQPWGAWYYDLLAGDTRHFVLLGMARGEIPTACWKQLSRRTDHGDKLDKAIAGLLAKAENKPEGTYFWPGMTGGGLFMQYLPGIFLQEQDLPVRRSAAVLARGEIELAKAEGYFPLWGISACETPDGKGYLGWDSLDDKVVTPHASVLAIEDFPEAAVANLRALEKAGMRPEVQTGGEAHTFGFTDSYHVVTREKSSHYLSLDQGMLFLSLANFLHDQIVRRAFQKTALGQKASDLQARLEK